MRCDNQHFVPAGASSCRRCGGGVVIDPAPAPQLRMVHAGAALPSAPNDLLTVGEYTDHRNLLAVVDAGVLGACAGIVLGGPGAIVRSIVLAVIAASVAWLAGVLDARLGVPGADLPATAAHVRLLDRLVRAPLVAIGVTLLSLVLRAS